MVDDPAGLVLNAARDLLGSRLASIVKYGSSVTGDLLIGYSDLDLAVALHAPVTLSETRGLQRAIAEIDPDPYSYYQPTFVLVQPRSRCSRREPSTSYPERSQNRPGCAALMTSRCGARRGWATYPAW